MDEASALTGGSRCAPPRALLHHHNGSRPLRHTKSTRLLSSVELLENLDDKEGGDGGRNGTEHRAEDDAQNGSALSRSGDRNDRGRRPRGRRGRGRGRARRGAQRDVAVLELHDGKPPGRKTCRREMAAHTKKARRIVTTPPCCRGSRTQQQQQQPLTHAPDKTPQTPRQVGQPAQFRPG